MSAYVMDRKDIRYLVQAGLSRALRSLPGAPMRWFWQSNGNLVHRELTSANAAEIGQMLWNENVKSVEYRYPEGDLPGPIDQLRRYGGHVPSPFVRIEPVQVLKTCDCYEYQSCEHPEWNGSEAKAFIDSLRKMAWSSLPGYEQAEWGSPEDPIDRG